jgi:ABC-type multidrug transport system fused ATPase/permease subunit
VSPAVTFSLAFKFTNSEILDGKAFAVLSLITLISSSLFSFTGTLPQVTASFGASDRIYDFLNHLRLSHSLADDVGKELDVKPGKLQTETKNSFIAKGNVMLRFEQVLLSLSNGKTLGPVTLALKAGDVLAVAGPTGSGKSALLSLCSGTLQPSSGSLYCASQAVGYLPQTPWLMNRSIRDNITGPLRFDRNWYDTVVKSCCLDRDIGNLPEGDATNAGTEGNRLSGGQRQRIVSEKPF